MQLSLNLPLPRQHPDSPLRRLDPQARGDLVQALAQIMAKTMQPTADGRTEQRPPPSQETQND